jgi:5-(carboxyamino)imidazole ribonucleotide mutase
MELLRYYESVDDGSGDNCGDIVTPLQKKRIIYVTVAGRSNALSGVVACNTSYPVIACPPFKDKSDMMVNINSTLQMPSKVPVMTILEPGNVALAIKRMFNLKNCKFGTDY